MPYLGDSLTFRSVSPGVLPSICHAAISGSDGRLLLRLEGTQPDGDFSRAVAIIGDVDGDGRDDIVVGIPGRDRIVCSASVS